MSYTVLGATGFIGGALARRLAAQGSDVWMPPRQSPEIFERPLGVAFYCIGLTADYSENFFATVQAHACYLAELLDRADIEHIVYLSSVRLYDQLDAQVVFENAPILVRPEEPRHLYDLTKALGENLCLTAYKHKSAVARISCVYDVAENAPGFLSAVLRKARQQWQLTLESSPNYSRDYITLDDAISALVKIGETRATGIYNVASGANTFNREIAETLATAGIEITFTHEGASQELALCSIDRLRKLGIEPTPTLEAIKKMFPGARA